MTHHHAHPMHHYLRPLPGIVRYVKPLPPLPPRPDVVVIPYDDGRGSGTPVVVAQPQPATDTPPS